MTICRSCSGEAVKIKDGKSMPRNCDDCVAQSLIKDKNNMFGIMNFERAAKLCSCLANKHEGAKELGLDDTIEKINAQVKKKRDIEESEIPENIYDKQKQHDLTYYTNRKEELKKLDEDSEGGVFI